MVSTPSYTTTSTSRLRVQYLSPCPSKEKKKNFPPCDLEKGKEYCRRECGSASLFPTYAGNVTTSKNLTPSNWNEEEWFKAEKPSSV